MDTPVTRYYEAVTELYRTGWGESHHFPVYTAPDQPIAEALAHTEELFADRGQFGPGMRVLDIGCGIGGPALNIARYSGVHVTGIDLTSMRVEIARDRAAEAELSEQTTFMVGDMLQLPFDDDSFDAAYSFDALCHASDKRLAYAEINRVLKPGSTFVGTDWLQTPDLEPWQQALVEPICRCHAIDNMTSLPQLQRDLEQVGFVDGIVGNLGELGDVAPNWTLLETLTSAVDLDADLPDHLRLMVEGGVALYRAANAGVFLIGHWQGTAG